MVPVHPELQARIITFTGFEAGGHCRAVGADTSRHHKGWKSRRRSPRLIPVSTNARTLEPTYEVLMRTSLPCRAK